MYFIYTIINCTEKCIILILDCHVYFPEIKSKNVFSVYPAICICAVLRPCCGLGSHLAPFPFSSTGSFAFPLLLSAAESPLWSFTWKHLCSALSILGASWFIDFYVWQVFVCFIWLVGKLGQYFKGCSCVFWLSSFLRSLLDKDVIFICIVLFSELSDFFLFIFGIMILQSMFFTMILLGLTVIYEWVDLILSYLWEDLPFFLFPP